MRESVIEKHGKTKAIEAGGEIRKTKWIGRRGAPDRVMMLPPKRKGGKGETVWVEFKATDVAPEPHQLREHIRMRRVGQTVLIWDSIEAIDKWFEER